MKKADFHIHTNYSDGAYKPEDVVDMAIDAGLEAIALTDHDNILSYNVAQKYLEERNLQDKLEIIQGVEINTLYKNYEVHILGYFMNTNDSAFQNLLKTQQQARLNQAIEILDLLDKKEGIKISLDSIKSQVAQGGSIGRPHIAKAITNAGGTTSVIEAYSKYINESSPVYVKRNTVSPQDAVEIIYDAGGIPVIAHPHDIDIAEKLIRELMSYGLCGIEAYHRKHSPAVVEYFSSMAEKFGLIVTGGSDFHAPKPQNGQILLGRHFIPEWIYDKLMQEKKRLDMARE